MWESTLIMKKDIDLEIVMDLHILSHREYGKGLWDAVRLYVSHVWICVRLAPARLNGFNSCLVFQT
jgi:hypothetical protein